MPYSDVLVQDAHISALGPHTLYRILALRVDVFVVEQNCVYRELDGRDLEPTARQVWAEQDGVVVATLRLLRDPDGCARIGRVATAAPARGHGLAGRLVQRAIELSPGVDVVLGAQSHLAGWYAALGFERDGADYDEDGIAHTPMRRGAARETRETRET